jgi:hypothetical protein
MDCLTYDKRRRSFPTSLNRQFLKLEGIQRRMVDKLWWRRSERLYHPFPGEIQEGMRDNQKHVVPVFAPTLQSVFPNFKTSTKSLTATAPRANNTFGMVFSTSSGKVKLKRLF